MILGITGQKRAGKDTVAKRLISDWKFKGVYLPDPLTEELCIINPWCEVTAADARILRFPAFMRFADLVKEIGIDEAKDVSADVRAYQQRYGTDVVRERIDMDRWCKLAAARIEELRADGHEHFVLPNIRAANELALCDGLLRVVRPGHVLTAADHSIETQIDSLPAQWTLHNDGDKHAIEVGVDEFAANNLGLPPKPKYVSGPWHTPPKLTPEPSEPSEDEMFPVYGYAYGHFI